MDSVVDGENYKFYYWTSGFLAANHAKGINRYFYIKSMPYYLLISPDKKIIYKTTNLDNYSKLFKSYND